MMPNELKTPPSIHDHHIGSLHALVVIVEYGDFECPRSGIFSQVIERLINEFKYDLCYIYRHFPIPTAHPNAMLAALAAEAGGLQSEFWNMHSLLFQNYDRLTPDLIFECAEELGLNMDQFKKDIEKQDLIERINIDINSGDKSGVNETPTLFINGHKLEEPPTYSTLREKIIRMIDEGQATYI